ncbi:hypothetical protein KIPB_016050, partial [Kipferlia bialata]|eukprot:g16050.t1
MARSHKANRSSIKPSTDAETEREREKERHRLDGYISGDYCQVEMSLIGRVESLSLSLS